jgi:hypothetical protein
VVVAARGRDLLTGPGGTTSALAEAQVTVTADFPDGQIWEISADPPVPRLDELVGSTAYSGFRMAAGDLVPADKRAHTLVFQLLDDVPITLLLSGRVMRAAGIRLGDPNRTLPVDICSGWVAGGSLMKGFTDLGPPLSDGPEAPSLLTAHDPLAWHARERPGRGSTSRCRRLDVWAEGDVGQITSWFRDSHTGGDGTESVVHEYAVRAAVSLRSQLFAAVAADPGPLPYAECPNAAASAARLVGTPVAGVRDQVSASLTGPSTCTHLNDSLRALEGVDGLLRSLPPTDPT